MDPGLVECDFGDWTGAELKNLRRLSEWRTVQWLPSTFRFPEGESFSAMQHRITSTLDRLAQRSPRQTFVAFSHADPIKAVIASVAGVPLDLFQRFVVSPCSVTALVRGQAALTCAVCEHDDEPVRAGRLVRVGSIMNETFDLGDLDRFTVGAVGPVGRRIFLLQCSSGRSR